jgi:hypothetical protein
VVMKSLVAAEVPDDEIHMVTWENACRWYSFDPFAHRNREQCTVAALRANATDVDTTPREYGALDHTHNLVQNAGGYLKDADPDRT